MSPHRAGGQYSDAHSSGRASIPYTLGGLDKHRTITAKDGARSATKPLEVRVTLYADLRKFAVPGQPGSRRCRLAAGATVADLVAELGIPPGELMTVGVNGELGATDTVLGDGDDVALFSPMEGG